MKIYDWNEDKNQKLIKERGVSFQAIISYVEDGSIIGIISGKGKFGHQKQFLVAVDNYIYIVPFIEKEDRIFLKTIIPSRKMTKRYLLEGGPDEKSA